ncbi:hypothetical protein SKA91_15740, partial [Enterococcus faecium]
ATRTCSEFYRSEICPCLGFSGPRKLRATKGSVGSDRSRITEPIMGKMSLKSLEGMGSNKHVDGFERETTELNSSILIDEKQSK